MLGKWRIASANSAGPKSTFHLEELKRLAGVKIPNRLFTREDYPAIEGSLVGRPIPTIYGRVFRAKAFCIDEGAKRFVFAGHAVRRILSVYADGELVAITGQDLAAAEFTYAGWDGSAEVTVDAEGKPDGAGALLANPADVIEDLITTEGGAASSVIDAASFAAARASWVLGTDRRLEEVHTPSVALYLSDATEILELIGKVQKASFAIVYVGHQGTFVLKHWQPKPLVDLARLEASDVLEQPRPAVKTEKSATRIRAKYGERDNDDFQLAVAASEPARLRMGLTSHVELETEVALSEARDAVAWAGRILATRAAPLRYWSVKAGKPALLLEPGDQVWIRYRVFDPWGRQVDFMRGVYDVIGVEKRPLAGQATLYVSDRRGLADSPGFLMDGTETFPNHLGGGSMAVWDDAWSAEQKEWALLNGGYFHADAYGHISPGYPETFQKSTCW